MHRQPSLFVSHGPPFLPLQPGATGPAWQVLFAALPERPRAVLVISAHWQTPGLRLTAGAAPATLHDFSGFPAPLYQLRYPAPGAPALAQAIARRLDAAGIAAALDGERGLDHGAWVPLLLMHPPAGIPVLQLSLDRDGDAGWHYRLGQALAGLRDEGVLVLASGSSSHNLREVFSGHYPAPPMWLEQFRTWLIGRCADGDIAALLAWRQQAPAALRNHPTPEHLLPFFVALGAGRGEAVSHGNPETLMGCLPMDWWRWG